MNCFCVPTSDDSSQNETNYGDEQAEMSEWQTDSMKPYERWMSEYSRKNAKFFSLLFLLECLRIASTDSECAEDSQIINQVSIDDMLAIYSQCYLDIEAQIRRRFMRLD